MSSILDTTINISNSATRSIGRNINIFTDISAWTYAFLVLSIVTIIIVNSILIQQNADLTRGNLLAGMIIDVIAVAAFLYGFVTLAHDLGEYVVFYTKPQPPPLYPVARGPVVPVQPVVPTAAAPVTVAAAPAAVVQTVTKPAAQIIQEAAQAAQQAAKALATVTLPK